MLINPSIRKDASSLLVINDPSVEDDLTQELESYQYQPVVASVNVIHREKE